MRYDKTINGYHYNDPAFSWTELLFMTLAVIVPIIFLSQMSGITGWLIEFIGTHI